ncbi:hypothetical protein [Paenibacillus oceani]|uniref:PPM-type phosphatase domain-containing protein n=1 Tax=Paenibacillus oceani TaxID=2772510 RepID=A0A927GZJ5_9BACL|nr:hypothetical protein [Paenibacillus oceani]MBD2862308.1 hypothetical protein [Paenibacillus oceani]
MKIVEQFSMSKTGQPCDNEDAIVVTDHFAAIIDGMTPKEKALYDGQSSARIAVDLLAREINSFSADIPYPDAVSKLTRCLYRYYKQRGILEEVSLHPANRMAASLILYSSCRKELWLVGDCQCLIDGVHVTNEKLVDHLLSDWRSKLVEQYLLKYSVDELLANDRSREDLSRFLVTQYEFQNNRYDSLLSYAVLDGFPVRESDIRVIAVSDAKVIVMASDGYPVLQEDRQESERLLHELLAEDPLCYRSYRSTKGLTKGNASFDDRSYLKLLI